MGATACSCPGVETPTLVSQPRIKDLDTSKEQNLGIRGRATRSKKRFKYVVDGASSDAALPRMRQLEVEDQDYKVGMARTSTNARNVHLAVPQGPGDDSVSQSRSRSAEVGKTKSVPDFRAAEACGSLTVEMDDQPDWEARDVEDAMNLKEILDRMLVLSGESYSSNEIVEFRISAEGLSGLCKGCCGLNPKVQIFTLNRETGGGVEVGSEKEYSTRNPRFRKMKVHIRRFKTKGNFDVPLMIRVQHEEEEDTGQGQRQQQQQQQQPSCFAAFSSLESLLECEKGTKVKLVPTEDWNLEMKKLLMRQEADEVDNGTGSGDDDGEPEPEQANQNFTSAPKPTPTPTPSVQPESVKPKTSLLQLPSQKAAAEAKRFYSPDNSAALKPTGYLRFRSVRKRPVKRAMLTSFDKRFLAMTKQVSPSTIEQGIDILERGLGIAGNPASAIVACYETLPERLTLHLKEAMLQKEEMMQDRNTDNKRSRKTIDLVAGEYLALQLAVKRLQYWIPELQVCQAGGRETLYIGNAIDGNAIDENDALEDKNLGSQGWYRWYGVQIPLAKLKKEAPILFKISGYGECTLGSYKHIRRLSDGCSLDLVGRTQGGTCKLVFESIQTLDVESLERISMASMTSLLNDSSRQWESDALSHAALSSRHPVHNNSSRRGSV
eukprot:CAMPEP_0197515444 /NCGR_PEP_ID=MMETSP1318-20131121/582_1 /TAXON_ID=552666 /ORGANISM="Partenskyella glossopodia, Strain RCC365" /LENGTH=662 /DNA_ID=CAMNT_0043063827 /DNA_START=124 /DNA_END=2112 /DNA_ORIENTATION=+